MQKCSILVVRTSRRADGFCYNSRLSDPAFLAAIHQGRQSLRTIWTRLPVSNIFIIATFISAHSSYAPVAYYFLDQLTARSGSWEAARAFCVQHVLEGYSELNKNKASKPAYRRNFYGSVLNILNLEPNITTS
jgi:hypothetical protein